MHLECIVSPIDRGRWEECDGNHAHHAAKVGPVRKAACQVGCNDG